MRGVLRSAARGASVSWNDSYVAQQSAAFASDGLTAFVAYRHCDITTSPAPPAAITRLLVAPLTRDHTLDDAVLSVQPTGGAGRDCGWGKPREVAQGRGDRMPRRKAFAVIRSQSPRRGMMLDRSGREGAAEPRPLCRKAKRPFSSTRAAVRSSERKRTVRSRSRTKVAG